MQKARTLAVVANIAAAALIGMTLVACSRATPPPRLAPSPSPAPEQPRSPPTALAGPLAALPAEIKAADFRVMPPKVERLFARRALDGSTVMEVVFGADPRLDGRRVLSLFPDGRRIDLHDDGEAGDERASDGVFSLRTGASFDRFRTEQEFLRAQAGAGAPPAGARPPATSALPTTIPGGERIQIFPLPKLIVTAAKSLTITATSVVEDPARTANPCTGAGAPLGKWSFGHLVTEMAGAEDPAKFTEAFFEEMDHPSKAPNGAAGIDDHGAAVLDHWPRRPDGRLDLGAAPLKLLAIVNRIDLAGNPSYGAVSGAEGRFVFEVMDRSRPGCPPLGTKGKAAPGPFLIILEYGVPVSSCTGLADWASRWIALGDNPLGSAAYLAELEAITDTFTKKNADPTKPNGSALDHIRINQIALAGLWTLQQFFLASTGLAVDNVSQTPNEGFDFVPIDDVAGGPAFIHWVRTHESEILAHTQTVPASVGGHPLLAVDFANVHGEQTNVPSFWRLTPIGNNKVRHAFSLDTCNGCHGQDTGTRFTQIGDPVTGTPIGTEAKLSGFLTGETIADPVDGSPLTFAELDRRAAVLVEIAASSCAPDGPVGPHIPTPIPFHLPLPPIEFQPSLAVH